MVPKRSKVNKLALNLVLFSFFTSGFAGPNDLLLLLVLTFSRQTVRPSSLTWFELSCVPPWSAAACLESFGRSIDHSSDELFV
mmetsp:Transcript_5843/g.11968  ORF Transcript_5843/g.11968 Transcript_5843/m.11968 type:complete len:83 (+) Transcript_5843:1991-2239(+)